MPASLGRRWRAAPSRAPDALWFAASAAAATGGSRCRRGAPAPHRRDSHLAADTDDEYKLLISITHTHASRNTCAYKNHRITYRADAAPTCAPLQPACHASCAPGAPPARRPAGVRTAAECTNCPRTWFCVIGKVFKAGQRVRMQKIKIACFGINFDSRRAGQNCVATSAGMNEQRRMLRGTPERELD